MLDQKLAEKIKRAAKKVRKCEDELIACTKGEEIDHVTALLKARKAEGKLLDQVEPA